MKAKLKANRLPTFREWLDKYDSYEFRLAIRPVHGSRKGWICGIEQVAHIREGETTIFSTTKRRCAQQYGAGKTPNIALGNFIHMIRGKLIGSYATDPSPKIQVPRHFRAA